jgi:hypothetical protein
MATAANNVEDQNVYGTPWRTGDRSKREGGYVIPGAICIDAEGDRCATDIERCQEVYAEGSRGHR